MKISIITVCYNSEETIKDTLNSLLYQSSSQFEYIIIDGKSTDKTLDIIYSYSKKFKNKKIKIKIISEKDEGLYDAMNKGLNLVEGDIIGILNSDDFYEPKTIENVLNIFKKNQNIDILHGNINILYKNKMEIAKPFKPSELLHGKMAILHPSVFIKRKVYEKIKFNKKNKIASDYEFLLDCYINKYEFYYNNFIYTNFRANGVSYQNPILGWKEVKNIALKKNPTKKIKIYFNFYKNLLIYFIKKFRKEK